MKKTLRDAFNMSALVLGGAGSLLFGIATVTEFVEGTPQGAEVNLTVPCALLFCAFAGLFYKGWTGSRKAAAADALEQQQQQQQNQNKPQDPQP